MHLKGKILSSEQRKKVISTLQTTLKIPEKLHKMGQNMQQK
jgi:hypothetical protein